MCTLYTVQCIATTAALARLQYVFQMKLCPSNGEIFHFFLRSSASSHDRTQKNIWCRCVFLLLLQLVQSSSIEHSTNLQILQFAFSNNIQERERDNKSKTIPILNVRIFLIILSRGPPSINVSSTVYVAFYTVINFNPFLFFNIILYFICLFFFQEEKETLKSQTIFSGSSLSKQIQILNPPKRRNDFLFLCS